jgi:hypothetical protein
MPSKKPDTSSRVKAELALLLIDYQYDTSRVFGVDSGLWVDYGCYLGLEQAADSEDLACLNGHMLVILRQGLFLPRAHGGQGTMSTRRCGPPQRGA